LALVLLADSLAVYSPGAICSTRIYRSAFKRAYFLHVYVDDGRQMATVDVLVGDVDWRPRRPFPMALDPRPKGGIKMDWQIIGVVIAIAVAALGYIEKRADNRLKEASDALQRDLRRIEDNIKFIEQTRPTGGELKIISDALASRILALEMTNRNRT